MAATQKESALDDPEQTDTAPTSGAKQGSAAPTGGAKRTGSAPTCGAKQRSAAPTGGAKQGRGGRDDADPRQQQRAAPTLRRTNDADGGSHRRGGRTAASGQTGAEKGDLGSDSMLQNNDSHNGLTQS